MKTIKIIDLLVKIANGEEPTIKYDNIILKYNKNKKRFIDKDGLNSLYEIDFSELNDEVEIIEEKKIPEKICTNRIINTKDILEFEMIQNKINAEYTYAINEIIDYLKSKGE